MRAISRIATGISFIAFSAGSVWAQQQPAEDESGDEIIVSGIRGALNEAVAIERASDTVISVITADDAGQFADQNVAESLQRIPGVTIQRVEGEGRTVQVRGLNSNFNQVVVNGAQIGSSDPDGNRSVSLDLISSDLLSGIRVAKTLTPDTDHDSLGAQVNLLTLSAFDREGTTARLRAEGGLTEYATKVSPKVNGDFTAMLDVGGEDTLGVALAVSYSERNIQSEEVRGNTPLTRYISTSGAVSATNSAGATRFLVPSIIDQRLKNNKRERIGGTLQLDFRPDDDNQFSLTVIGAQLKDQDVRTQNEWEVGQTTVSVAAAATGSARYNTTRLEQQLFFQDSTDRLFAANFYGENKFSGLTFSYGADYSKNRFTLSDALRARFATGNNLTLGVNFDEDQADVTVIGGSLAPSAFAYNQTLIIDESRTDEIYSGFANLKYDFALGDWEASLKVGGKYRDRTKVIRRGELSINPTNGTNRPATVAAGLPINLAGFPINTRPRNANFSGFFSFPDSASVRDVAERAAALFNLQPTGTRLDFDFAEETWAGYVQGQVDFSPSVSLIGGVRVEQTDYTASGLVVETIELDGNDLPPLGAGAPQSFNRKSTEYFPSLHLRADLSDQIVGRLSYSRGQVRPTFDDAKNFQEISTTRVTQGGTVVTTERELEGGNPQLEPLIADQFDATLGWYPSRSTSFTVAAFYKKLKNPFISATFSGPDVVLAGLAQLNPVTGTGFSEADTVGNGGSGKLMGIELGANHQFTGPFEGFFVTGNLTLIDGEARSQFIRNNESLRLEDQAKLVGNLSAGFENDRFTGRVSATYVGNRLESVDASNPEFDVIRAGFYTVDVNLRFNLTDNFQLYADIANLTDQIDYRYYRGIEGAGLVSRTSAYGRTFQVGAIVSF